MVHALVMLSSGSLTDIIPLVQYLVAFIYKMKTGVSTERESTSGRQDWYTEKEEKICQLGKQLGKMTHLVKLA